MRPGAGMAALTEQRGLAAIEQAGGPDRARFALRDEACYPPAKGRIAETYCCLPHYLRKDLPVYFGT